MDSENSVILSTGPGKKKKTVAAHSLMLKLPRLLTSIELSYQMKNYIVMSDKRYWKQGVKLLATPVAVGIEGSSSPSECCHALMEASFEPSNGELVVKHVFS